MKKEAKTRFFVSAAALLLLPVLAFAHPGHGAEDALHADAGFLDGLVHPFTGLVHPFTGLDHLAAMLAVGVWSALAVRPVWLAPAAFVALLTAGATAGFLGVAVPAVEPMIAASLLVLGLLVAWRRHLAMPLAAGLAGAFAFFHGAAHGTELGGSGQWLALAGMVIATAALHATGIALGHAVIARHRWLAVMAGASTALLGATLLVRMA
ncbi:HupE/UreJ family protein [Acidovorax sp. SUPP3334]|uniref:HupE/UreJ family protein n=1 Tax=Acidovorax sp. SUPP3334 TaxID=2920881 RepID=UPI0023DE2E65|nr:HupE/UreJ family protein [Acidovorax sp. SUPP3334]GKT25775.1 HupE/UreJ family protein [Acidovorax sp. SUPP3334]